MAEHDAPHRALLIYLAALVGRQADGVLETRWRHQGGMRRQVWRVADELPAAAAAIAALGERTDIYVGCAPRRERPGGLDELARVWTLWVDCDTPAAVDALRAFTPAPAIVIRSGSRENRHAYWTLTSPVTAAVATAANRRLAHALGADPGAVTSAAAILRPPGTRNHKHTPATPVVAERLQPWRRVNAARLVDKLAEPPEAPGSPALRRPAVRPAAGRAELDGLRDVAPRVYVEALTGLRPGRDGKVSCPFHGPDTTPSLHIYETAAEGWYCYGCGRGGSVFDLGAEVWGLSTRGPNFVELRTRLRDTLSARAPETDAERLRGTPGGQASTSTRHTPGSPPGRWM
jgi:RepB DNA-primase from phage plasmid/CHC2 zinc finger